MSRNQPDWLWDEMRQVGTDYADVAEVAAYDARMAQVRDVDRENAGILRLLGLPKGADVLEIGCGTGRFALAAARAGMRTTAIDVSGAMVDYVRARAEQDGLAGLSAHRCGFLTMPFADGSFDAVVSGLALHHLSDAWKLVALRNVARVLRPGGQLLLKDVVFSVADGEEPEQALERFVEAFPKMRTEVARHVAREFSTFSWIMEGLLQRAGFAILSAVSPGEAIMVYHGRRR
ncbi:MAG: Demethylrebeccamycin-D-glucose O-methyltransferase [Planctomycetes bacterium ADurb.Bin126]|nr:MAG: Demethylrebeccamycin-D-glucose O-methyltransferase [Planctomycetes bacterium ADurb.Bin126]HOD82831.1 class I SAM-dependent methyltransferase [Phycisphaerae bacterium]HQL74644.1 class I SAM-dependent methyltransferase [Phycisphaerae bacterium]